MLKNLLCLAVFALASITCFGQSAIDDYNKALSMYNQASGIQQVSPGDNETLVQRYLSAVSLFNSAMQKNKLLASRCKFYMYSSLVACADEMKAKGSQFSRLNYVTQAINTWPEWKAIPVAELTQALSLPENGRVEKFPAISSYEVLNSFAQGRYIAAAYYYSQADDEKMGPLAIEVHNIADNKYTFDCEVFCYVYYKYSANTCPAARCATRALILMSDDTKQKKYSDLTGGMLNSIKDAYAQYCLPRDSMALLAPAMARELKNHADIDAGTAFSIGDQAWKDGHKNAGLLLAMRELAGQRNNADEITKWEGRIKSSEGHFGYYDDKNMSEMYARIGDKARTDHFLKKVERHNNSTYFHVLIGTNPYNYFIHQYPFSIDFTGRKVTHGFRYNLIEQASEKSPADGDKMGLPSNVNYSGYQVSYTLKYTGLLSLSKGVSYYLGPEFRYNVRNYTDSIMVQKIKTSVNQQKNLNASGQFYDLTLNIGYIIRGKWLFADIYTGLGVSYRTFNSTVDKTQYTIVDYRYKEDNWNKIYLAGRLGLRIGLAF